MHVHAIYYCLLHHSILSHLYQFVPAASTKGATIDVDAFVNDAKDGHVYFGRVHIRLIKMAPTKQTCGDAYTYAACQHVVDDAKGTKCSKKCEAHGTRFKCRSQHVTDKIKIVFMASNIIVCSADILHPEEPQYHTATIFESAARAVFGFNGAEFNRYWKEHGNVAGHEAVNKAMGNTFVVEAKLHNTIYKRGVLQINEVC